jgi:hypothetical protein
MKDLPLEIESAHAAEGLRGVWIWIDERCDQVGRLDANRAVFDAVNRAGRPVEFRGVPCQCVSRRQR